MILRRQRARVRSEPIGQVTSSGVCLVRPRMVAVVSITERSSSPKARVKVCVEWSDRSRTSDVRGFMVGGSGIAPSFDRLVDPLQRVADDLTVGKVDPVPPYVITNR